MPNKIIWRNYDTRRGRRKGRERGRGGGRKGILVNASVTYFSF